MKAKNRVKTAAVLVLICIISAGSFASEAEKAAGQKVKIFDGKSKVIVVNGYSTSFQWPRMLQEKLDRYTGGKRVITVMSATKGGTPIAKWLDIESGKPSKAWLDILRPKLQEPKDTPVIVLAQQSLQWAFGQRTAGIRNADDKERIKQGADALEKYVKLLKEDGADLVFVAMHIYKHPMEPEIGNERYALAELIRRKIPGVEAGPDVWEPTKKLYPQAFAGDGVHPNTQGAELMAQNWFEALLKYDGLKVPGPARRPGESTAAYTARIARERKEGNRPREAPGAASIFRDIEYVPDGHERQKLDLYLPETDSSLSQARRPGETKSAYTARLARQRAASKAEPLPVVIWIHGGAWKGGSKDRCPARRFLQKGYAAASINYRLSQHALFPAQIEDCKAAMRWLRANAKKYGLDPKRFGVWGSSAGGHLVALLGTTGDVKEFDKGQNLDFSSRVQAVCDFFGPADFTKMSSFPTKMDHDSPDSPESKLIGGAVQENKEKARRANPITYVTKDDPPFLIVHGDKDPLVPLNQSEIFYEALKKTKVKAKFHTVKGGGHGFKDPEVDIMVDEFFDRYLKGKEEKESKKGKS